jgi:hypothetical protein
LALLVILLWGWSQESKIRWKGKGKEYKTSQEDVRAKQFFFTPLVLRQANRKQSKCRQINLK